jgi:hypothetical protein
MRFRHLVIVVALTMFGADTANAATTFTVTNQGTTAYLFNGANPNGTLTLVRGQTYVFDVTVNGHPFNITTQPGLPLQDFSDPGLTGQGAMASTGALTFTVPASSTSTLFYQCGNHPMMNGPINLVASPPVPAVGLRAALGLGLLVLLVGLATVRRLKSAR